MSYLSRRAFVTGASAMGLSLGLAGCASTQTVWPLAAAPAPALATSEPPADTGAPYDYRAIYAAIDDDQFPIPAIDLKKVDPAFLRASVDYDTDQPAGTIVIDTRSHYLHHVLGGGRATRYGVGVGREGFVWAGEANIHSKQEWPDWYPPKEMIQRQPEIKAEMSQLQSGIGMAGGVGNPLGARAMYLWQGNKDTLFRIHGTIEPWTIGKSVSSGCIRMINQDVIDLYDKVEIGTKVVVLGKGSPIG